MTILWALFIFSIIGIFLLLYVSNRRLQGRTFPVYEKFLVRYDDSIRKRTFRVARKSAVVRDLCLKSIQRWAIVVLHLSVEVIHLISAKINKILARMRYQTRKKAREVSTKKPSEFLRQVREERE